jgi:RNA polymerase sigma factor (TIGR02999 family)
MTLPSHDRIEQLIARSRAGDEEASNEVAAALYAELHRIATSLIGDRPVGVTLQATALVHEAWLRMRRSSAERIADRNHFIALAARAMRCALVDHARQRGRRDGDSTTELAVANALDQVVLAHEAQAFDLVALDDLLEHLAQTDPDMARAVELRFFAGLDLGETADAIGMPRRTFERQ